MTGFAPCFSTVIAVLRPFQPAGGDGFELGHVDRDGVRADARPPPEEVVARDVEVRRVDGPLEPDEVTPGEVGGVGGRGDQREQLGLLLLRRLPAGDGLVEQGLRVRLAALGGLGGDVLEHDLHARAGAGVGDAGAHHPGAEDRDLGGPERVVPLRPQLAGVDRLQVEEERLDHVLGVLPDDQAGQVPRLDPRRGVEVDHRALDGGGQDRALRGVVRALGLLTQQGRERGQERRQCGRLRRATGHLVPRAVPRVLRGLDVVTVLDEGVAIAHGAPDAVIADETVRSIYLGVTA